MNCCLHNSVVHTTGYFGNWTQCLNLCYLRHDVFEIRFWVLLGEEENVALLNSTIYDIHKPNP